MVVHALTGIALASTSTFADGCFVYRWDKQRDINEPTQKAIILHDRGREDVILQVKYEGPAEEFGWIVPVPGHPEVRVGSMQPFYELSRLTQKHEYEHRYERTLSANGAEDGSVKVIQVKTVGAYEVTVLSSTNASSLANWLAAHHFVFPKEKESVLQSYVQQRWFFVAARVAPERTGFVLKSPLAKPGTISSATRAKLASGELHPIIISFPSERCVFPLAISSVNGAPSDVSLYVFSTEPLISRVIFERKVQAYEKRKADWLGTLDRLRTDPPPAAAETRRKGGDPNDLPPAMAVSTFGLDDLREDDLVMGWMRPDLTIRLEGDGISLRACRQALPRLRPKTWWLVKTGDAFAAADMEDLVFEPALPFLTERLRREGGEAAAYCLARHGPIALPAIVDTLTSSDSATRMRALAAAGEMKGESLADLLPKLLLDEDPKVRQRACRVAEGNWHPKFLEPLLRLVRDPDERVAMAAYDALDGVLVDPAEIKLDDSTLRRMLREDGPDAAFALRVLLRRRAITPHDIKPLLNSTNHPVVLFALASLRATHTAKDLAPVANNPEPVMRVTALGALSRIGDKEAIDRIVTMLNDSDEFVRWRARLALRVLTGQRLGADPAAYEKWWAEKREKFVLPPSSSR